MCKPTCHIRTEAKRIAVPVSYTPQRMLVREQVPPQTAAPRLRDARIKELTEYQRFLVFMKIMFKFIEQHEDFHLLQRAKHIVEECTRRHRLGDENFMPLQECVTVRLRIIVRELYWNLARDYLGYGCD